MNFAHLAGHLGADPEVRFTSSGKKVTTLRLATKARKGGNDETIWWRATIWGEQFDKMIPYLKKGSPVIVFGEIQKPEIFTDREGKPQISMEITVSLVQFSPFGKPDNNREGEVKTHATGPTAPFGQPQDAMPVNPYMKAPGNPTQQPAGQTFDDEVPF